MDRSAYEYTDAGTGRSYHCGPWASSVHFADVGPTDSFCRHVHYVWARGFTEGCQTSPASYCPNDIERREKMAELLVKAFGLTLYSAEPRGAFVGIPRVRRHLPGR